MEEDRVLSCLALSFDYGLYQVLLCSLCGATVILRNSFCFPNQILSDLRTERASAFPVLPTMVSMLARFRAPDGAPLDNIRYITNTGQKLTSSHIGVLKKLLPNARIFSMYGLTECKRATYLPPEKLERKPDSVGQAIPNTEAWLIDEQGNRIETPDTEGQLVIRGSHVMKGYWNKPDETARALHNGALPGEKVLYTGDYFTMDDEGDLYFVTRHDDLIKTAGHRIGPGEIEVVVSAIHGVSEAAAVGIDDPVLGQAVAVFLVAENGRNITAEQVLAHCSRDLEPLLVPRHVILMPELPKTATGKIDKSALKHMELEENR
jgi:acyl-coenzyme A synthetase/AMP-(fatty) acid ligase